MKTLSYVSKIGLDHLVELERPVPTPGRGEILVRVHAVSLNHRDLAIARGAYGGMQAPLVPLSDAAGVVVALGPEARRFAVGDRVCAAYVPDWIDGPPTEATSARRLGGPSDGVLSEYLCLREEHAVRAPSNLSFEAAATLPVAGVSVWQALVTGAHVRPGAVVGVSGTGGASLFAVAIARVAGARVVVVGRDAARLERVGGAGVITVDASAEPAWEERVVEQTGGGVDVFLDVLGGDALARSIASTRVGGTVFLFGFVAGRQPVLDLVGAIRRAVTLQAISGGSRASFEALVRAIEAHDLEPTIDRIFDGGLAGTRAAFAHLAEGRPLGKVVIRTEVWS